MPTQLQTNQFIVICSCIFPPTCSYSNNSLGDCSSNEVSTDGENGTPERRPVTLEKPHPLPPISHGNESGDEAEPSSLCEREYAFSDEVVDLNSSTEFAPPEGFFHTEGGPDLEDEDDVSYFT